MSWDIGWRAEIQAKTILIVINLVIKLPYYRRKIGLVYFHFCWERTKKFLIYKVIFLIQRALIVTVLFLINIHFYTSKIICWESHAHTHTHTEGERERERKPLSPISGSRTCHNKIFWSLTEPENISVL